MAAAPSISSNSRARLQVPAKSAPARLTAAAPSARTPWSQVSAALEWRTERRVRVASVPQLFRKIGKHAAAGHAGERVAAGKRRHSWPDRDVFKAPRAVRKKGGEDEWVAVEAVLKQFYEDA